VTLHELDEGVDTGKVLMRRDFALTGSESAFELYHRAHVEALNVFREAWPQLKCYAVDGDVDAKPLAVPQDEEKARLYTRSDLEDVKRKAALWGDDAAVRALDFPPFADANSVLEEDYASA
jgi:methionyl-tRNA formyltransferase